MTRDGSMHPFDSPENVVFDDYTTEHDIDTVDPYPNVTRALEALRTRGEVLWPPPQGCGLDG